MNFDELSILVIDDSSFIRDLVKTMLQTLGTREILLATDGINGLDTLIKNRVDIVLCDLSMEPMDGIGFVKALRKLKPEKLQDIPVIFLTVHDESDFVEQAIQGGADGYLLKPISVNQLEERVELIMKNKKMEIEKKKKK